MRPFSPRMFPHRAFLLAKTDGADAIASVVESLPEPTGDPLLCRIRSTGSRSSWVGDQEVTTTLAEVAFPADPGCRKGDFFLRTPIPLTLRALAPARARDGDGVLFVVECEVRD